MDDLIFVSKVSIPNLSLLVSLWKWPKSLWWVVVVSKPILVISLKPKPRLINLNLECGTSGQSQISGSVLSIHDLHIWISAFRIKKDLFIIEISKLDDSFYAPPLNQRMVSGKS